MLRGSRLWGRAEAGRFRGGLPEKKFEERKSKKDLTGTPLGRSRAPESRADPRNSSSRPSLVLPFPASPWWSSGWRRVGSCSASDTLY